MIDLYNELSENNGDIEAFLIINQLFNFEVDFDDRQILIQAQIEYFPEIEEDQLAAELPCSFLLVNFAGKIISKGIVYEKSEWDRQDDPRNNFIRFLDKDTLIYLKESFAFDKDLAEFWKPKLNQHFTTFLVNRNLMTEYEGYEYFNGYAFHQQKRLFAVLFTDPDNKDSLKVLRLMPDNTFELLASVIFDYRQMRFHSMAFNAAGDELAVMEIKFIDYGKFSIHIRCYSVTNLSEPFRIVDTGLVDSLFDTQGLYYYNENIVCFILSGEMRLFDLEKNTVKTLVQTKIWKTFFISLNQFFYVREELLSIYNIQTGDLLQGDIYSKDQAEVARAQQILAKKESEKRLITFPEPQKESFRYRSWELKEILRFLVFIIIILLALIRIFK